MGHTVTVEEIEDCIHREAWSSVASCGNSDGSNKRLEYNNRNIFRVTDHGQIVYEGFFIDRAVAAYNAAP